MTKSPAVTILLTASFAFSASASLARADIQNWQTNQTIPGTEGIVPGPGINLSSWNTPSHNLRYADFTGANLSHASFSYSDISGAIFTDAIVTNANLDSEASYLTADQLYSTASYQNHDLTGILLVHNNLSGWDFTGQNLTGASLGKANVSFADLRGATISGFNFSHDSIFPDGSIHGLTLLAGEHLVVRDYSLGISVQTAMSLASTAGLDIRFSSGTWGSTMSLPAGVIPALAGTLDLRFGNGVSPNAFLGTTYHLFNWNGQLPGGSHFDQITSPPGYVWDTSALYTLGNVTLTAVPEPTTNGLIAAALLTLLTCRSRRKALRAM